MKPGIHTYHYASARVPGEGLRIGVARHLPRGIRREDWSEAGYFDFRLSLLAPSAGLLKQYRGELITWSVFARRYRAEMNRTECCQVIELLAGLSLATTFGVGCFCQDETRCHRSLLRQLIADRRAALRNKPRETGRSEHTLGNR